MREDAFIVFLFLLREVPFVIEILQFMAVVIKDVLPDLIDLLRVGILAVQVNVIIELFENETP